MYHLLATCDQNTCSKCHKFKWIVNITYKRFDKKNFNNIEITLCEQCIKNSEYDSKNHHCPFHNTHVLEDGKIILTAKYLEKRGIVMSKIEVPHGKEFRSHKEYKKNDELVFTTEHGKPF
jgi:hypothetical protein